METEHIHIHDLVFPFDLCTVTTFDLLSGDLPHLTEIKVSEIKNLSLIS